MEREGIKKALRERYGRAAKQGGSCCARAASCCGDTYVTGEGSGNIGYTEAELEAIPEGADLGLGCGNPVALASLQEGEVVLDLGSGAGIDCFLAAENVGENGEVIGIDMTVEMLERARENARKGNFGNVEFRLGEIENLPVADNSVDVVISNCVINLSPDKARVFREAFRVLKSGGRLMVSDIVLLEELPASIKTSIEAYAHCLSGALLKDEYIWAINSAGFEEIKVIDETPYPIDNFIGDQLAEGLITDLKLSSKEVHDVADAVISAKVSAVKNSK